jgi:hypothetical protein
VPGPEVRGDVDIRIGPLAPSRAAAGAVLSPAPG